MGDERNAHITADHAWPSKLVHRATAPTQSRRGLSSPVGPEV
jgi:hypothetical protein